jgi:hypothetical protein
MSVTTTADEKIRKAKECLSEAYKELLIVLDEDTWGHNDLKESYLEDIQMAVFEIMKIKKKL